MIAIFLNSFSQFEESDNRILMGTCVSKEWQLRVYFNTVDVLLHISYSSAEDLQLQYSMHNAVGEIIFADNKRIPAGLHFDQIDISFSPNGIYFLKLETTGEQICRRIVLVH